MDDTQKSNNNETLKNYRTNHYTRSSSISANTNRVFNRQVYELKQKSVPYVEDKTLKSQNYEKSAIIFMNSKCALKNFGICSSASLREMSSSFRMERPSSLAITPPTSQTKVRTPSVKEKKDRKRERWLLTRKTWKYMTDAGRKLIPDGTQNRPEYIPKLENHFQSVCASEPKFIVWKRKFSYPGAIVSDRLSKKYSKQSLSRSNKSIASFNTTEDTSSVVLISPNAQEVNRLTDQILKILQNYLCLNDSSKESTSLKTTKTVQQNRTILSPKFLDNLSPKFEQETLIKRTIVPDGEFRYQLQTQKKIHNDHQFSRGFSLLNNDSEINIKALLGKLHEYNQKCEDGSQLLKNVSLITSDILEDPCLLKQIYIDLKNQQINRLLKTYPTKTDESINSTHISEISFSIPNCELRNITEKKIIASESEFSSLNIRCRSDNPDNSKNQIVIKCKINVPSITYSTIGTQTNFIHLHELQLLSKDFENKKIEEESQAIISNEDGINRYTNVTTRSRRKSSIDNEDVSQSVSNTIKRYLRMVRKKSVNDNNANRFKCINYDRNLRNITAKGEINPPGIDEGNSKQTQTFDSWAVISLANIRGIDISILLIEAHTDWKQTLNKRIQNNNEYLKQIQNEENNKLSTNKHNESDQEEIGTTGAVINNSSPHSSFGILHTGQQFLSNLWHGSGGDSGGGGNRSSGRDDHMHQPSPSKSRISISSAPAVSSNQIGMETNFQIHLSKNKQLNMQKSKSSSNVGQFVSKKMWRSRSKSQTRLNSLNNIAKSLWSPQGNGVWMSSSGHCLVLNDTTLGDLTEIEGKVLYKVAIEKINQLNIGINVKMPPDVTNEPVKTQKRRPLLMKRKAITTSFFDCGKNKQLPKSCSSSDINIFGVSLEKCVENDKKLGRIVIPNGGKRNQDSYVRKEAESLETLLDKGKEISDKDIYNGKLNSNVTLVGRYFDKYTPIKVSRSQSDIRRGSHRVDDLFVEVSQSNREGKTKSKEIPHWSFGNTGHKVPSLVLACIKHLEENGLNTIGIFRVSTSKKRVRQLREDFDHGQITAVDSETCPHDVATLLKEYFRDLPEPLLCQNLYKAFVKTQKIRNRRLQLEALSHLVQILPPAHRDTLYYLLKFLAKVVTYSDDIISTDGSILLQGNKMDSSNLATVFAPNILRPTSNCSTNTTIEQDLDEQIDVINVIRAMIDHYEDLFRVPSELLDEIYTYIHDTYPLQLNLLCERRNCPYNSSSSTPVSSPPPEMSSPCKNQQTQVFKEFIPTIITSNTIMTSLSRQIYSREDVMHERAATTSDQNNVGLVELKSGMQRRNRTSRMEYAESDRQRRRRLKATNESKNSNNFNKISLRNSTEHEAPDNTKSTSSNTSHIFTEKNLLINKPLTQYQSELLSNETSNKTLPDPSRERKLSSRLTTKTNGVVSACLKIPVQVQQKQHRIDFLNKGKSSMYNSMSESDSEIGATIDFSDIPYIEDVEFRSEGSDLKSNKLSFSSPFHKKLISSNSTSNILNHNNISSITIPTKLSSFLYKSSPNNKVTTYSLCETEKGTLMTNNQNDITKEFNLPIQESQQQTEIVTDKSSTFHGAVYKRQELISSAKKTIQNK